jgi:endonuclease/exonuclease/phosphatase family metal-dependent hydrolase
MRIRVVSYNVHKCIGGIDRRYDPYRIADVIGHYDPHFALLQETAQASRLYNHDRQHEKLADLLGFRHVSYFVNVRFRRRGEYGNAILSRFPLTETSNIDLTIPPKKRRSVLHARYRVRVGKKKSTTLHVYNLHLGLSGVERKMQLRKFLASDPFARLDHRTPLLVAGDFNDVWGTLGPKLLEPAGFSGLERPIRTFPAYAPIRALDSLYVKGNLRIERVYASRLALAREASDHLPLVADLRIERARGARRQLVAADRRGRRTERSRASARH